MGRAKRRAGDERGSAIMETAMSTVIFLTFLFGIFETGFALYTYFFISEAAREATRYAIVRGSTAGTPAGTACSAYTSYDCQASITQIKTFVQNLGYPGINPSNMTIPDPVWTAYTTGSSCPVSPPCNSPGNQVAVTVQYNFPLVLPFAPKLTYTMSSTSAMIIAQ
jgi:Flp pilus assembly protein TadG